MKKVRAFCLFLAVYLFSPEKYKRNLVMDEVSFLFVCLCTTAHALPLEKSPCNPPRKVLLATPMSPILTFGSSMTKPPPTLRSKRSPSSCQIQTLFENST